MPRYLLETGGVADPEFDDAIALAARQFPEVAVEHRYSAHDETSERSVWVCRAPSETHVRRWAAAARLTVGKLQHVASETREKETRT